MMHIRRLRLGLLVIAFLAVSGFLTWKYAFGSGFIGEVSACKGSLLTNTEVKCTHDAGLQTYERWKDSITFPYVAPDAKLQKIKHNYAQIDVGSSKREVIEAFGPPDFEEELYPKEPRRPCSGYEFVYYIQKPAEITNEFSDIKLSIFFKPDGKVTWIVGNVGVPEKGRFK